MLILQYQMCIYIAHCSCPRNRLVDHKESRVKTSLHNYTHTPPHTTTHTHTHTHTLTHIQELEIQTGKLSLCQRQKQTHTLIFKHPFTNIQTNKHTFTVKCKCNTRNTLTATGLGRELKTLCRDRHTCKQRCKQS